MIARKKKQNRKRPPAHGLFVLQPPSEGVVVLSKNSLHSHQSILVRLPLSFSGNSRE
jgi:hypothetical protein